MVFSSLLFLYAFLPVCLIAYFACRSLRAKNIMLMFLSLFFYAWGEPLCVFLLVACAGLNFICGRIIGQNKGQKKAKTALVVSVVISLGTLAVFKYLGFIIENINLIPGIEIPVPAIVMPIGISFFTFQTLSYTIDVYREKTEVQPSFVNFLLYVSLFPQLIAGPILRYSEIAPQLTKRQTTLDDAFYGAIRFCCGLGKKVLIANYAGSVASGILDGALTSLAVGDAWLGIFMFGFQIYFDFSAYSDMAIGLGRIFGFHYGENFNLPYISKSITEFWRRWHISLGSFFRDYVYIPLGGNRTMHVRNLLITWFLTGLWHGASWNFILWGLYYFVLLVIEKYLVKDRIKIPKLLGILITYLLVHIGWILFYFTDISRLLAAFSAAFGLLGNGFSSALTTMKLVNNIPLLIVCVIGCTPLPRQVGKLIQGLYEANRQKGLAQGIYGVCAIVFCLVILFLSTSSLVGASYNPFLYFRF